MFSPFVLWLDFVLLAAVLLFEVASGSGTSVLSIAEMKKRRDDHLRRRAA